MNSMERMASTALDLRRELTRARLGRRELAKLGLLAGGACALGRGLTLRRALAAPIVSPPTQPWVQRMPVPDVMKATSANNYDPDAHQWCRTYFEPRREYVVRAEERDFEFHPDLPKSPIWGYEGTFPGPTIDARYGEPILLQIENRLPRVAEHKGFGHPQITTHLHNFHTASESDGGPWNWHDPGTFRNNHYCMARAGFSTGDKVPAEWRDEIGGDLRESMTTLFFHDHRPEFTAANVYKGLVGMFRVFDEQDTGDETRGWGLPSGDYDVPLVLADKQFDPFTGELTFDQFAVDGFLGDKITVNGAIQPYFEVEARKYRFRLLNGGPSRFYRTVLRTGRRNQPFTQVTESGNFFEFPRSASRLDLWVADRADIIVDFARYKPGTKLYLANVMEMRASGRGIAGTSLNPDAVENQLVEFRVVPAKDPDPSRVPGRFRPMPTVDLGEVVKTRVWKFERKNGMWAINGRFWDPDIDHSPEQVANPPVQVKRNTAEVWVLDSSSGGWEHPIHIHFEEGQTIKRNGVTVPAAQRHRVDVHRMGSNKIEVFMRFRDFPAPNFHGQPGDLGRYVMHCHNMVHEDHAMMATWNIVA